MNTISTKFAALESEQMGSCFNVETFLGNPVVSPKSFAAGFA